MDKYTVNKHLIEGREVFVLLPPDYNKNNRYPVLYFHDGKDMTGALEKAENALYEEGGIVSHITVAISTDDRLRELTPWEGPALSERFKDFGGGGDAYLSFIEGKVIPFINENYAVSSEMKDISIGGVSLGGLISIYALYKSPKFGNALSISGSLWYVGFTDFLKAEKPLNRNARLIMVSGSDEGKGKPEPLCHTPEKIKEAKEILDYKLESPVSLLWDEGGHHDNRIKRIEEGIKIFIKNKGGCL